ncbi:hypothetical protein BZA77DRAFT_348372 [Pyronema omphalodes]|nr:hypothetical protein BZA77DRAFT_348372 [Pyronema omphalodes]
MGYYELYLSSLCRRRRWTDPLYRCYPYPGGFASSVAVNNRDYQTDDIYQTEELAREAAAMKAYLVCRNLSVSEAQGNADQQFRSPVSVGNWDSHRP